MDALKPNQQIENKAKNNNDIINDLSEIAPRKLNLNEDISVYSDMFFGESMPNMDQNSPQNKSEGNFNFQFSSQQKSQKLKNMEKNLLQLQQNMNLSIKNMKEQEIQQNIQLSKPQNKIILDMDINQPQIQKEDQINIQLSEIKMDISQKMNLNERNYEEKQNFEKRIITDKDNNNNQDKLNIQELNPNNQNFLNDNEIFKQKIQIILKSIQRLERIVEQSRDDGQIEKKMLNQIQQDLNSVNLRENKNKQLEKEYSFIEYLKKLTIQQLIDRRSVIIEKIQLKNQIQQYENDIFSLKKALDIMYQGKSQNINQINNLKKQLIVLQNQLQDQIKNSSINANNSKDFDTKLKTRESSNNQQQQLQTKQSLNNKNFIISNSEHIIQKTHSSSRNYLDRLNNYDSLSNEQEKQFLWVIDKQNQAETELFGKNKNNLKQGKKSNQQREFEQNLQDQLIKQDKKDINLPIISKNSNHDLINNKISKREQKERYKELDQQIEKKKNLQNKSLQPIFNKNSVSQKLLIVNDSGKQEQIQQKQKQSQSKTSSQLTNLNSEGSEGLLQLKAKKMNQKIQKSIENLIQQNNVIINDNNQTNQIELNQQQQQQQQQTDTKTNEIIVNDIKKIEQQIQEEQQIKNEVQNIIQNELRFEDNKDQSKEIKDVDQNQMGNEQQKIGTEDIKSKINNNINNILQNSPLQKIMKAQISSYSKNYEKKKEMKNKII